MPRSHRPLTAPMTQVIRCLNTADDSGLSMSEIIDQTGIPLRSLGSSVDGLQARGFVLVINTKATWTGFANRHSIVRLTPRGHDAE